MSDDANDATEGAASPLVQSVDRAITLLEVIAANAGETSITALAKHLGVHKSTVSRLLVTLEAHELVEQPNERGRYRLGLGMLRLAGATSRQYDLVRLLRPSLTRLSTETGETANLVIQAGGSALYLDQVSGSSTLVAHSWVGQRIPLHATSNGKVLLAFHADPSFVAEVLDGPLPGHAPRSITDPAALRANLAQVRRDGFATAVDEWEEGLTAVAAPVRDHTGEVIASISLSGPGLRMNQRLDALTRLIRAEGEDASRRLGATALAPVDAERALDAEGAPARMLLQ